METNEIMKNEDVIETTVEEVNKTGIGKGLKIAAGAGLTIFAGVLAYKYVAKPLIAKLKAKKATAVVIEDYDDDCV